MKVALVTLVIVLALPAVECPRPEWNLEIALLKPDTEL